jgi:cupin fold WbuC family metalloprotein
MANNIYSKIEPERLLHVICKSGDEGEGRTNLIPDDNALQASLQSSCPEGHTFKGPHKHLPQGRETHNTQESWIVIKGRLEVTMYDLDDSLIGTETIGPGDFYVYLGGGHGLKVLEEGTTFYEVKNGPYQGQAKDKVFYSEMD